MTFHMILAFNLVEVPHNIVVCISNVTENEPAVLQSVLKVVYLHTSGNEILWHEYGSVVHCW